MDDTTTSKSPTPDAYEAACAALWAHRDRATAFEAGLDAILDALVGDVASPAQRLQQPTNLQEAVAAYRTVMRERRKALAATGVVWDQIEAAAIREIDRHMTRDGR